MKNVILILTAISLQLFFYLSLFEVVETDIFDHYWVKVVFASPLMFVGSRVMASFMKHIHKWVYNIVYLLLLVCGVAIFLYFNGVYLGTYTYIILFMTILPLSYGAYSYCNSVKKKDSWHFVPKVDYDESIIINKLSDIEEGKPIIGRSYDDAQNLKEKHDIFSLGILKYAQGEFETLKQYLFKKNKSGCLVIVIEQPIEVSDMVKESPLELENPHIYCDGSQNAILVYNSTRTFGLDYMNEKIYKRVNDLKSILVIEVELDYDKSRPIRAFYVPVTRIEEPVVIEQSKPHIEQPELQREFKIAISDSTRGEMRSDLPQSDKISNEKLYEIKEQLVDGLKELNVDVECVEMEIGEKSLTCQLRYGTIPPTISASGFPCNINIFYRLLSIDREQKIITIDIPYKNHVA